MATSQTTPHENGKKSILETVQLALIGVLALGILASALQNDLVWDDTTFIKLNEHLGQTDQLSKVLLGSFWQNSSHVAASDHYWRPLTTFATWMVGRFFGPSPVAFHTLSVAGALFAAGLFAVLVAPLVSTSNRMKVAVAAGALHLLHPLSIELLAMSLNVADHLALGFIYLGIHVTRKYLACPRFPIRTTLLLFGIGLGACCSKELGVCFAGVPIAAAILQNHLNNRFQGKSLVSAVLWIGCILPVITYLLLRQFALADSTGPLLSRSFSLSQIPLGIGHAFWSVLLPTPTGAHAYVSPHSPIAWGMAAAAIGVLLVTGFTNIRRKRFFALSHMGLLFGMLLLIPSLLRIPHVEETLRLPTRYLHVLLPGCILAALPLADRKWTNGARLVVFVATLLFGLLSLVRVSDWRTHDTTCKAEYDAHPDHAKETIDWAKALFMARKFDESLALLQAAAQTTDIEHRPYKGELYSTQARIVLARDRDVNTATQLMELAIRANPFDLRAVFHLAEFRAIAGHPEQAQEVLSKAMGAPWFTPFQKRRILQEMERYQFPSRNAPAE